MENLREVNIAHVFSLLCFPLDPLSFPLDPDRQSLRPASCAAGWRHGGAARRRVPALKEQRGREAGSGAAAAVAGTSPRALAPGGSSELRRVFFFCSLHTIFLKKILAEFFYLDVHFLFLSFDKFLSVKIFLVNFFLSHQFVS